MDASWELQEYLYARLSGDPTLVDGVAEPAEGGSVPARVGVYDDVPEDAAFPFVVIGDDTQSADEDMDADAAQHTVTIHVWSRYRGRRECKRIMGRIHELIHLQPFNLPNHKVWLARREFASTDVDPDGVTRHGVMRFRFGIADAA